MLRPRMLAQCQQLADRFIDLAGLKVSQFSGAMRWADKGDSQSMEFGVIR